MCSICCDPACTDGCPGVDRSQGDPGAPAFLALNFVQGGLPYQDNSDAWVEAGRFVFSTDIAEIFTSIRLNIWRTGGVDVSWQIVDLVSSLQIATGTVTSASDINIETVKGLQIFNSTNAIIAVQIMSNGNTVNIGSAIFAYEE